MPKQNYNMHLIINTHWDREYRWSFCETQHRSLLTLEGTIPPLNGSLVPPRPPGYERVHMVVHKYRLYP